MKLKDTPIKKNDDFLSKKPLSWKEVNKRNDDFLAKNPIAKNEEEETMRRAAKLMASEKFNESLELYKHLAKNYPDKKGLYESQVGANYFFLGEYFLAVEHYIIAMNNGFDKDMSEYNIWEAVEIISKYNLQLKDGSVVSTNFLIEKYLDIFPNGKYRKKAKKLLCK